MVFVPALHMQPGSVREFEFRKLGVGVGQPVMTFPRLDFAPTNLFLCGSPLGRLLAIRGDLERIGLDYSLPTCSSVFNVFHPVCNTDYCTHCMLCVSSLFCSTIRWRVVWSLLLSLCST